MSDFNRIYQLVADEFQAVIRRETGFRKWPILQFLVMGGLAWLFAWVTFLMFQ